MIITKEKYKDTYIVYIDEDEDRAMKEATKRIDIFFDVHLSRETTEVIQELVNLTSPCVVEEE
jgi:hypothetical protein